MIGAVGFSKAPTSAPPLRFSKANNYPVWPKDGLGVPRYTQIPYRRRSHIDGHNLPLRLPLRRSPFRLHHLQPRCPVHHTNWVPKNCKKRSATIHTSCWLGKNLLTRCAMVHKFVAISLFYFPRWYRIRYRVRWLIERCFVGRT